MIRVWLTRPERLTSWACGGSVSPGTLEVVHVHLLADPLVQRPGERASELARFFCSNAGPDYISHSELMGSRALSLQDWRPDLAPLLEQEIEPLLRALQNSLPPDDNSHPILVVENGQELVGLAFVTFAGDAPCPFAVVEDLLVDASQRGSGLGKAILDWITSEALARNCRRLFIESGERNIRGHSGPSWRR